MDDLDALLDLEYAAGDDPWGGEEDEDEGREEERRRLRAGKRRLPVPPCHAH